MLCRLVNESQFFASRWSLAYFEIFFGCLDSGIIQLCGIGFAYSFYINDFVIHGN